MASTPRDEDAVLDGLVDWWRARDPATAPEVVGHERPAAGFSTDTFLVDLRLRRTGADDAVDRRIALKLPPRGPGIFPTYDFGRSAAAQQAAAEAGIPVAVPVQVELDPRWLGSSFCVMPAIAGHIIDELPVRDPRLVGSPPAANAALHGRYVETVAAINRIDPLVAGDDAVRVGAAVPRRDNRAEIAHWREYLSWYGSGAALAPALDAALDWCDAHQPASEPPASLLWGDVRLGNVIFDEGGVPVAVLDWEMATVGAAEHDLAWMVTLEATQAELLGRRVPGFPDHDATVARYEVALGRAVRDLSWYEILAIVRSSAIMTRIAHLRELAGHPPMLPLAANPILDILARRIAEADRRP